MGQVKKPRGAHSPKMGAFGLSGGTGAAAASLCRESAYRDRGGSTRAGRDGLAALDAIR